MRNDIPDDIMNKLRYKAQTIAANADPRLSLIVSRKHTALENASFFEKRRARKANANALSDCRIAVCHPKYKADDSDIWLAYIESGMLKVRRGRNTVNLSENSWKQIDIGNIYADRCDLAFISEKTGDEYITGKKPVIFYLDIEEGLIVSLDLNQNPITGNIVVDDGASDFTVKRCADDAGLCLFYLKNGALYYVQYSGSSWRSVHSISSSLSGITRISSFDTQDGVGLLAYAGGKLYQKLGLYTSSFSWGSWEAIGDADGMGAVAEYHDNVKQAFYTHDVMCYREYSLTGYGDEVELYDRAYAGYDSDNLNKGSFYMAMILNEGNASYINVFRYIYMKDASSFTKSVSYTLQVDNSITQVNATIKNINDALYNSEATLFAPSSKIKLGVSFGNSEVVDMATVYIDEVTHQEKAGGGDVISLSARNVTGAYLHDLTFDDHMELKGVPSVIVATIMDYFGITDYLADTRADVDENDNPCEYTLLIEPDETGLKALEDLGDMLSDDAAFGMTWKTEERFNGTLVIGYDDFRNNYQPKTYYTFNGRTDVFAKNVQRCIDGAYSQVRCTGTTLDGREIAITYPVTTWPYWNPGQHKTYHADKIEGIDETLLQKYAKTLAQQLKKTGVITTYEMNLCPQLLIGDVARITYPVEENEDPEIVGIITEIMHSMGEEGYNTNFVIDSGGNLQENGGLIYSANAKLGGKNRKTRLADFFGNGKDYSWTSGGMQSMQQGEDFVEEIRNIGMRLLDEPTDVEAEYDADNNTIKIKWADPADLTDNKPVQCAWAGTAVVRSEAGAPINIYKDCILIKDSTTRNEHKITQLVDNTDIKKGKVYYYGIFPYHVALDDANNPIKYYRFTKVFSIRAGSDLEKPIIKKVKANGVNVKVTYEIKPLASSTYALIKLAVKKDSIPTTPEDADEVFDLQESGTSIIVRNLDEESQYYFVIFVADSEGDTAVSDPASCKTGAYSGETYSYTGEIQTFTAPKTGIYKLETWGAQGGDATDGTNTARGGYGAYATGEVFLQQGDILYIAVGGQDGYNGGGSVS